MPTTRGGRRDRRNMEDSPKRSSRPSPDRAGHHGGHDDHEEEQFILSVSNTPVNEEPPKLNAFRSSNLATSWASFDSKDSKGSSRESQASYDDLQASAPDMAVASGIEGSQPIAIEAPQKRGNGNNLTPTPTAPLSARGDLPGGYFPEHENRTRVHRTHPFHADAKEARRKSIARACIECSPDHTTCPHGHDTVSHVPSGAAGPLKMPPIPGNPALRSAIDRKPQCSSVDSHSSSPSISSYNPTGVEDNLLPMGKYYPTNWENRKKAKRERLERQQKEQQHNGDKQSDRFKLSSSDEFLPKHQDLRAPSQSPLSAAATSPPTKSKPENPLVTRAKAPPLKGHGRSDSEAKRRLQQYQRDMITHATTHASRVLGSQIQKRGVDDVLQSLNQLPALQNLCLPNSGGTATSQSGMSPSSTRPLGNAYVTAEHLSLLQSKPVSPRLVPLGSPGGPMTPMDLSLAPEDKSSGTAAGRPRMPVGITTAPARDRRQPSQGFFPFGQEGS